MTHSQFNDFQARLLAEVVGMKDTKGKEYANSEDRFANFNKLAIELGMPNIKVGWVYLKKHLDSIASYVKDNKTYSTEPIRGRIVDAITYLTLIAGMIEEQPSTKYVKGTVIDTTKMHKEITEILNEKPQVVASNLDEVKCIKCDKVLIPAELVVKTQTGFCHQYKCTTTFKNT